MTLTVFVLVGKMSKAMTDGASATRWNENIEQDDEWDMSHVEEVHIKDPDSEADEDGIPVIEASDDDDAEEEDWPERDDGPDHYGWEEVYDLNDCSPEYL